MFLNDESAFQFNADGALNIEDISGDLAFSNIKFSSPLRELLPETFHEKYHLGDLHSNGALNLSFSEKISSITCRGNLFIDDFDLENRLTSTVYKLSGKCDIDANYDQNGSIKLNSMMSSLDLNGSLLIDLTAKGDLNLSGDNKSDYLELRSNSIIDLQKIFNFAKGITDNNESDAAADEESDADGPENSASVNPLPEFKLEINGVGYS